MKMGLMEKLCNHRFIYFLVLVNGLLISCVDRQKECNEILSKAEVKSDPAIVFNLIDCLNESNKKVISLASIASKDNKDIKQLLLEIKKDQLKIDSDLKILSEKNLIIIPKLIPPLAANLDSLKGKNSNSYLLKTLESEIKNQIIILDNLEKYSENNSFKTFSKRSKIILLTNKKELQKSLST